MPVVEPNSKILVSGVNGFIAVWVAHTLLEKGYAVRGTVRSEAKAKHLYKIFEKYGDRFEIVVIENIVQEGAFDEAVKGIDAIEHIASPVHFLADDPQELIGPAVSGTIGILKSALNSAVKRIVITSSSATIVHIPDTPTTFSEVDWNDQSIRQIEELGKAASPLAKYRASKTLAERAAWDFYNKHKSSVKWDLSVINPPLVFGPVIHEVSSLDGLNASMAGWARVILFGDSQDDLQTMTSCWVDVRDLAEAHARTLLKEAAGGERIIISAGSFVWQDWIDIANSVSPSPIPSHALPKGSPGAGNNAVNLIQVDNSKGVKILEMDYRSMEETTRDILANIAEKGW